MRWTPLFLAVAELHGEQALHLPALHGAGVGFVCGDGATLPVRDFAVRVNATLELLYGDTGLGHRELQDSAARYSETQAEWLRRARPESLARDLA